ncbi:MAG: class I SAM-dependent methyltransferase [Polyangiaceae bacterium]
MVTDATRYREDYDKNGLSPTHKDVIDRVPAGARVLEVGCSSGYIGKLLMAVKGCSVAGIEVDPRAAEEARSNGLNVFEGSLEDPAFRASINERWDVILATDVLEHLRDPAPVLEHFKEWLAPGGRVIIAVPNIATWQIRKQLMLRGDFEYQESGILDRTHLHFFTWLTLHKLVASQGWDVVETMTERDFPFWQYLLHRPQKARQKVEQIAKWGAAGRWVSSPLRPWVELAEREAKHVADFIYGRWPNLCVQHITLVLAHRVAD